MLTAPFQLPLRTLHSRGKSLRLDSPRLMGILNITQDSFSDGSLFFKMDAAIAQARKMIADGADWLDIGGESSGPDSTEITQDEELQRVIPLIKKIREVSEIWISVDTWKSEVARKSLEAGADAVNDVTALRGDTEMVKVIAEYKVPVILMFSKDRSARTSRQDSDYVDVVGTLKSFFSERLKFADSNGIDKSQIVLDPGMGFFISGKAKYSFEVIQRISELHEFELPLLLGPSRKSFLAGVTKGRSLKFSERDIPCATVSSVALWQGVTLLRFHEVEQGRKLIDTIKALKSGDDN
ncbi:MAG: dihydropteroate synthase [SAR324 cluster bacterium]|nr:dihydropteroate synthase [SAR324 cluster bacterium]MED5516133.1 dihydropteroate synthase [SAR324 cluster bacterium]MED6340053.1 dihydropteroate synthase [SAR324 cluster bacterium]